MALGGAYLQRHLDAITSWTNFCPHPAKKIGQIVDVPSPTPLHPSSITSPSRRPAVKASISVPNQPITEPHRMRPPNLPLRVRPVTRPAKHSGIPVNRRNKKGLTEPLAPIVDRIERIQGAEEVGSILEEFGGGTGAEGGGSPSVRQLVELMKVLGRRGLWEKSLAVMAWAQALPDLPSSGTVKLLEAALVVVRQSPEGLTAVQRAVAATRAVRVPGETPLLPLNVDSTLLAALVDQGRILEAAEELVWSICVHGSQITPCIGEARHSAFQTVARSNLAQRLVADEDSLERLQGEQSQLGGGKQQEVLQEEDPTGVPLEEARLFKHESKELLPSVDASLFVQVIKAASFAERDALIRPLLRRLCLQGGPIGSHDFCNLVRACDRSGLLDEIRELSQLVPALGLAGDVTVWTAVVNALLKADDVRAAALAVWEMQQGKGELDPPAYEAVMKVYCKEGKEAKADKLLKEIQRVRLQPTAATWQALIALHAKEGRPMAAKRILHEMRASGDTPSTECYNLVLRAFLEADHIDKAIQLARSMPGSRSLFGDEAGVLSSLGSVGELTTSSHRSASTPGSTLSSKENSVNRDQINGTDHICDVSIGSVTSTLTEQGRFLQDLASSDSKASSAAVGSSSLHSPSGPSGRGFLAQGNQSRAFSPNAETFSILIEIYELKSDMRRVEHLYAAMRVGGFAFPVSTA